MESTTHLLAKPRWPGDQGPLMEIAVIESSLNSGRELTRFPIEILPLSQIWSVRHVYQTQKSPDIRRREQPTSFD